MNPRFFTASDEDAGTRLDRFLARALPDLSRSRIQELIGEGLVLIDGDGARPSHPMRPGETAEVRVPDPEAPEARAEDIPLSILYEDDDILVVDKPRGMSVHPGAGHMEGTLVNALLHHCGDSLSGINGVLRTGIVHRIDKDTSGVLLVCKSDRAHRGAAAQLADHSMDRVYLGITNGTPVPAEGTIRGAIGRSPKNRKKMAVVTRGGKEAVTHYRVEEELYGHALCSFRLETGRTHQIRVHMAYTGHPLFGDTVYGGGNGAPYIAGQALHAVSLGFVHPVTGSYMSFRAEPPEDFQAALRHFREGRS